MNRSVRIALVSMLGVVSLLAVVATQSQSPLAGDDGPQAGRTKGDVVMIRCTVSGSDPSLSAYQGSAGTPAKKTGGCVDNLSLLLKDGFEVRDVGHYDEEKSSFVLYTLIR